MQCAEHNIKWTWSESQDRDVNDRAIAQNRNHKQLSATATNMSITCTTDEGTLKNDNKKTLCLISLHNTKLWAPQKLTCSWECTCHVNFPLHHQWCMPSLHSDLVYLSLKGCTHYAFVWNDDSQATSLNSLLKSPHAGRVNQTWTVHTNLPNESLRSLSHGRLPSAWEALQPNTLPFYNWQEPCFGLTHRTRLWD